MESRITIHVAGNHMANSYIQVRTNETDKEQAGAILEELGTNLSTVINMLLKQIIITKSIPFEIKLNHPYTNPEIISEVQATMKMENMELNVDEVQMLKKYQTTDSAGREAIRNADKLHEAECIMRGDALIIPPGKDGFRRRVCRADACRTD
jgi:addiction module RelB/DinJ family antitoxin